MATTSLTFNSTPANNNWYNNVAPKKNEQNYTIPANQRIASMTVSGVMQGATNSTYTLTLVSDASSSNPITLGTTTKTNGGTSSQSFNYTKTFTTTEGNSYAGKTPYLLLTTTKPYADSAAPSLWGQVLITLETGNKYTAVVAGNLIYKSDLEQAATPDSATLIKYRTAFSAGDLCSASTFNSDVLGF